MFMDDILFLYGKNCTIQKKSYEIFDQFFHGFWQKILILIEILLRHIDRMYNWFEWVGVASLPAFFLWDGGYIDL